MSVAASTRSPKLYMIAIDDPDWRGESQSQSGSQAKGTFGYWMTVVAMRGIQRALREGNGAIYQEMGNEGFDTQVLTPDFALQTSLTITHKIQYLIPADCNTSWSHQANAARVIFYTLSRFLIRGIFCKKHRAEWETRQLAIAQMNIKLLFSTGHKLWYHQTTPNEQALITSTIAGIDMAFDEHNRVIEVLRPTLPLPVELVSLVAAFHFLPESLVSHSLEGHGPSLQVMDDSDTSIG